MTLRRRLRILRHIFTSTCADKIIYGYLVYFLLSAAVICLVEPDINSFFDAVWFCFAAATTIGFGDLSAVTIIGRLLTMLLSVYSLAVVAIFTAVITSYFLDFAKSQARETVQQFIDDLEHLPDLSHDRLVELSRQIKIKLLK